jgi:hypothetical protein
MLKGWSGGVGGCDYSALPLINISSKLPVVGVSLINISSKFPLSRIFKILRRKLGKFPVL